MRARPLLTALALATAALPAAAGAAGPVTQSRIAVTEARIALPRGHWVELELRLASAGGAQTLIVQTRRCGAQGCGEHEYFSGPVRGSEVSGSEAAARLRTVLDGLAVSATWSPNGTGTVVLGGTELHGGPAGDEASTYRADPAVVQLVVGGVTCKGAGAVGDEVRVADSDTASGAPLSELELPQGALSC